MAAPAAGRLCGGRRGREASEGKGRGEGAWGGAEGRRAWRVGEGVLVVPVRLSLGGGRNAAMPVTAGGERVVVCRRPV